MEDLHHLAEAISELSKEELSQAVAWINQANHEALALPVGTTLYRLPTCT
jgi:hypothetical protein